MLADHTPQQIALGDRGIAVVPGLPVFGIPIGDRAVTPQVGQQSRHMVSPWIIYRVAPATFGPDRPRVCARCEVCRWLRRYVTDPDVG